MCWSTARRCPNSHEQWPQTFGTTRFRHKIGQLHPQLGARPKCAPGGCPECMSGVWDMRSREVSRSDRDAITVTKRCNCRAVSLAGWRSREAAMRATLLRSTGTRASAQATAGRPPQFQRGCSSEAATSTISCRETPQASRHRAWCTRGASERCRQYAQHGLPMRAPSWPSLQ